jgi:hypothetical protein
MGDFWRKQLLPALTNPFYLLYLAMFGVAYLELSHTAADLVALRRQDAGSNAVTLLYGLYNTVYITAFIAGFAAIVYRLAGREPSSIPDGATIREKVVNGAFNPFKVLRVGLYLTPALGAAAVSMSIWEFRGGGEIGIWRSWTSQTLGVLISLMFLAAMSAIAGAVGRSAPSGAADDEPAAVAASPGPVARLTAWLSDPIHFLATGLYAIVVLGLVTLSLDMWQFRGLLLVNIWQQFFSGLFRIAVGAGSVLVAVHILARLRGAAVTVPEAPANRPVSRLVRYLSVPETAVSAALAAAVVTGALWLLLDIWSWRNSSPAGLWRYISFDVMWLTARVSLLLLIWSAWNVHVRKIAAPAGLAIFGDPYTLAKWLIFIIAYAGVLSVVLMAWLERPLGPATIWSDAVHVLSQVAGPIAALAGFRAIYLVAARIAAPAAAMARTRRAATAESQAAGDS